MKTVRNVNARARLCAKAFTAISLALVLAATIAACGPEPPATTKLPPIPQGFHAPVFLVIDDCTGGQDPAALAARTAAFGEVVRAAWDRGAAVVLLTVGAGESSPRTVLSTVAAANVEDSLFAKPLRDSRTQEMLARFRAADLRRSSGTADVIAALREAQAQLRSIGNGHFEVLIMSSGQMRTPVDVVDHPAFLADPVATAQKMSAAGLTPSLISWNVTFLTDQPSTESQMAVAALWWQILQQAGAQLTGFQQAIVRWPEPPLAEPRTPGIVQVPTVANKVVLRVSDRVLFNFDSASLRGDAGPVIAELARILTNKYPTAPATITGFTDNIGSSVYNLRLSRKRAAAVASALASAGVAGSRLTVGGRGASGFVASNDTAEGRAANRRVEIVLNLR
jgi:outer membrane protein OmpA-like peptidoglycan-associated protein